uniref:RusA family crossover junction endodeoxyribonuclease n=1 Tax=Herbidospora sakaeratensis TaxID=564415 RepID=UPI00078092A1|nr:RusA family crossover junction endodeoxyribonuclease [Herbidospora sakaeratensis]
MKLITITAYGSPEGQAAISCGKNGRGYYSNAAALEPWRAAVRNAAMDLLGTHQHVPPLSDKLDDKGKPKKNHAGPCQRCGTRKKDHGLLRGALRAEFIVALERPKSVPLDRDPITRSAGDWDHHGRAIGDALNQASVMCDDAQIVDGRVAKYYAGHPNALAMPGAIIRIWPIGGTS